MGRRPKQVEGAADVPDEEVTDDAVDSVESDFVMVDSPKEFTLFLDSHRRVFVKEGAQQMHKDHAGHWYAKAHGVKIIEDGE